MVSILEGKQRQTFTIRMNEMGLEMMNEYHKLSITVLGQDSLVDPYLLLNVPHSIHSQVAFDQTCLLNS